MKSITYGELTIDEMIEKINSYLDKDIEAEYNIVVGSDSQNSSTTKVVVVVAVHRIGKGGIFFYEVHNIPIIKDLRRRVFHEANLSLGIATKISDRIDKDILVHIDIGKNGPTSKVIPEIVGWITSCGYDCIIKPDSYAASSIADKFSK